MEEIEDMKKKGMTKRLSKVSAIISCSYMLCSKHYHRAKKFRGE